jgi:hypothetical protein
MSVEVAAAAEPEERPSARAAAPGDELEEILARLGPSGSAARIIVHRLASNRDPEECIDCPLPLFSKEQLRADYGPGHYQVEVREGGKIRRRWEWRFARPLEERAPAVAPDRASRERELEQLLAAERERAQQRAHELMLALVQREGGARGPSLGELLGTLTQAKELLGAGGAGSSPREALGMVKDVLELTQELGGGAGERETTAADVVRVGLDRLPQLTELLRAAAAVPAAPPASATNNPKALAPPARSSAPATTKGADPMLATLTQLVPMILKLQSSGMTPVAAAELITPRLEALGDEEFSFWASLIAHPHAVPMLTRLEPRLAGLASWLEQVAGELRAFISRETADSSLPEAPARAEDRPSQDEVLNEPAGRGTAQGTARRAPKR